MQKISLERSLGDLSVYVQYVCKASHIGAWKHIREQRDRNKPPINIRNFIDYTKFYGILGIEWSLRSDMENVFCDRIYGTIDYMYCKKYPQVNYIRTAANRRYHISFRKK